MDFEPKVIVSIVVVIIIVGAGAFVVLRDDTPTADRPSWSVGYDWWYNFYEEEKGGSDDYARWGDSYQLRVHGLETIEGTPVYNLTDMDTSESRLDISDLDGYTRYISRSTLNLVDRETGEEFDLTYRWPLEDGDSWSRIEENVTVHSTVTFLDASVPAGTFETFRITHSGEYIFDEYTTYKSKWELFYCDKVKNTVKFVDTTEIYDNGSLTYTELHRMELLAYGLSDKDDDGLSGGAERWLGSNPGVADTDGDGVVDGEDYTPLFDLKATLELRHFSTADNCEDALEQYGGGENSGCDVYFIITNSATDDQLVTTPTTDQGNFDLQEVLEVDVPDDLDVFHFLLEALDEDDNSAHDTIDINEYIGHGMDLRHDVFQNRWSDNPDSDYEAGNEYTTSGNGEGDYDGDLTWFLTDTSIGEEE